MLLERFRELSQGFFAKILLGLITIPFALFGIDAYFRDGGGGGGVAKVDGTVITTQRFQDALRGRMDQLRTMLGPNSQVDIAQLNTPQMRQAVLKQLIDQAVVEEHASAVGLVASDQMVAERIVAIDAFKEDGKFSQSRYEKFLGAQGTTPARFEQDVRKDLALQSFQQGLSDTTPVPQVAISALARLTGQTREVSVVSP